MQKTLFIELPLPTGDGSGNGYGYGNGNSKKCENALQECISMLFKFHIKNEKELIEIKGLSVEALI